MVSDNIKEYYDSMSNNKLWDFIEGNPRVLRAWNMIKSLPIKPKNILEIGCGTGEIAWRMSQFWENANILAWDISPKSIDIAKRLFVSNNLSYVAFDSIFSIPTKIGKYDLVVLVDVYEHIPPQQREELSSFLKSNVASNGYVFLSCPTPRHLAWLRENQPSQIQPVDESIHMLDLLDFANKISKQVVYYKEISVWSRGDYFHCILSSYEKWETYSDHPTEIGISLKKELIKRILKIFNKSYDEKRYEPSKKRRINMAKRAQLI
jgi:2-polyprenyl-3-methyl-5-hydroxy-6-metoxy-1,4-benzoquinol methylase